MIWNRDVFVNNYFVNISLSLLWATILCHFISKKRFVLAISVSHWFWFHYSYHLEACSVLIHNDYHFQSIGPVISSLISNLCVEPCRNTKIVDDLRLRHITYLRVMWLHKVNPLCTESIFRQHKYMFVFSISARYWNDTGCLDSLSKQGIQNDTMTFDAMWSKATRYQELWYCYFSPKYSCLSIRSFQIAEMCHDVVSWRPYY